VKEYCEKYPLQAYNIFQTYLDLYIGSVTTFKLANALYDICYLKFLHYLKLKEKKS